MKSKAVILIPIIIFWFLNPIIVLGVNVEVCESGQNTGPVLSSDIIYSKKWGMWWTFYISTLDDLHYEVSYDGLSFGSKTLAKSNVGNTNSVDIAINNAQDRIYMVWSLTTSNEPIKLTIFNILHSPPATFEGELNEVSTSNIVGGFGVNYHNWRPRIEFDTNDDYWIVWDRDGVGDGYPYVYSAGNIAPTPLNTQDGSTWYVGLSPLKNGNMIFTYRRTVAAGTQQPVLYRIWNGTALETEGTYASSGYGARASGESMDISSNIQKNYASVAWMEEETFPAGPYILWYRRYDHNTKTFGSYELGVTLERYMGPEITCVQNNDIDILIYNKDSTDHIYYRQRTKGVWSVEVDWIDESIDTLYNTYHDAPRRVNQDIYESQMGLAYATGRDGYSDYWNKFQLLDIGYPPEAPYLIENTTEIHNADGTNITCGSWLFKGEAYNITAQFNNTERCYYNFTDGIHEIRLNYNNLTGNRLMWVSGEEEFVIGLIGNQWNKVGTITTLSWIIILNKNVNDYLNTEFFWYAEDSYGNYTLGDTDMIVNIYNLGNIVSYDIGAGNAGRVQGGSALEVWAEDSTGGFAYAEASTIYRKLQHVHFLVSIDVEDNDCWDIHEQTGRISMGIRFLDQNHNWIDGWYLEMVVVNGAVDEEGLLPIGKAWDVWSISWYARNGSGIVELRDTDILSSYPECGDDVSASKSDTRFWVDFWFDKLNSSTVVAARINSYYYGLEEKGNMLWSNWSPIILNETLAMFYENLYDSTGNVLQCSQIELMEFWVQVFKVGAGAGESCDTHRWSLRNYQNMNFKTADDRMVGVDEPTLIETKTVDMPQGGFMTPIVKAIQSISEWVWAGAFGFINVLWGAMDTFFERLGLGSGVWSRIVEFFLQIPAIMLLLMNQLKFMLLYMSETITNMFSLIILIISRVFWLVGKLIWTFTQFWSQWVSLFTGGWTNVSNIWVEYEVETIIEVVLVAVLPFWELIRIAEAKDSLKQLRDDVSFFYDLMMGFFKIFNVFVGIIMNIMKFLRSLLPI